MPELPVNEQKIIKKKALRNAEHERALHFMARQYEQAEAKAVQIVGLQMELREETGVSELSDLHATLDFVNDQQDHFFAQKVLSKCPILNERALDIEETLRTKYSVNTDQRTRDRYIRKIAAAEEQVNEYEKLKQEWLVAKKSTAPVDAAIEQAKKVKESWQQRLTAFEAERPSKAGLERKLTILEDGKKKLAAAGMETKASDAAIEETKKQLAKFNDKDSGKPMSKDVGSAVKVQDVEVVRHGDKLTIPQNLDIQDAIRLLQERAAYEEKVATIVDVIDVFPWDGAIALGRVLKSVFGWVPQHGASVKVESGVNETTDVPWGEFTVPGVDGKMVCDVAMKEERLVFQLRAYVKHKHEHVIHNIIKQVRELVKTSSIYRGKAIKIRFLDEEGETLPIPEPKFIDVMSINENQVAYATAVQEAIETNLFTPIRRLKELEANGLPIKRAVMLGGIYGTGKTLAAGVAAKLAVQQGMTYIYVPRADELRQAINFSKMYQDPAVMLFCEDLDRVMKGQRTVKIDDILNIIDGVDTKNDRRMLVFTTNDLEAIEPAMIRPGRLDAVIEVTPPDARAAWRLVQIYGGDMLRGDVDGEAVGKKLDGQIPAVIAEVVRRAKLSELKFTPLGERIVGISTEALLDAAETMTRQLALLNRGVVVPTPLNEAMAVVGDAFAGIWKEPSQDTKDISEARGHPSKMHKVL